MLDLILVLQVYMYLVLIFAGLYLLKFIKDQSVMSKMYRASFTDGVQKVVNLVEILIYAVGLALLLKGAIPYIENAEDAPFRYTLGSIFFILLSLIGFLSSSINWVSHAKRYNIFRYNDFGIAVICLTQIILLALMLHRL